MASFRNPEPKHKSKDIVLKELRNLFGTALHIEVIKSVATQCEFDFGRSSHYLLEMTNHISHDQKPVTNKKGKNHTKTPTNNPQPTPKKTKKTAPRLQPSPSTNAISKKSKKLQDLERVCHTIRQGYKVLVILRGLPGSGKSRLATAITDVTLGPGNNQNHVLSTDDFFVHPRMGYVFDPNRLQEAHAANQAKAFSAMSLGLSPVIIDNTNCQMWEMRAYAGMATDYGYIIEILEPDTWWCFNDKELAKRNKHNVPRNKIKDMLDRYDKNVTPQKLLVAYNLNYKFQKPPQFRLQPPITTNLPIQNGFVGVSCNQPSPTDCLVKSKSTSALNRQPSTDSNSTEGAEMINLMDFTDETPSNYDNGSNSSAFWDVNPVDEILMWTEDNASNILQPNQVSKHVNESSGAIPKKLDIENAWGVDEKALQSWDIVTPIQCEAAASEAFEVDFAAHADDMLKPEYKDSSTDVELKLFHVLAGPVQGINGLKIVEAKSRDINFGVLPKDRGVPKKIMLDKSCLTEDECSVDVTNEEEYLQKLVDFFPTIPRSYLKDLYYKCNKNFNWAVDVLLDDKSHSVLDYKDTDEGDKEEVENVIVETVVSDSDNEVADKDLKVSKRNKSIISEEALELKRCLESKIDISKDHYSEHVYKVKQYRFGGNVDQQNQPSTSSAQINPTSESDDSSVEEFEDNPKNMIELNLGDALVDQLKTLFGVDDSTLPGGFQPVIQMPKDLALQIFTLYAESVCQQMEAQNHILERLEKEDEEFARKLQMQEEARLLPPQKPPNLTEIMDEQIAMNIHQKHVNEWKNMTADNLAARLTRQKLFEVFPMVSQDVLIEILHAYGNNYNRTVQDLMTSVGAESINGSREAIQEPPLAEGVFEEMKEAEQNCEDDEEPEERKPPTYYREEANKHLLKREQLYEKAKTYYQRGMTEVAMFYSELAKKETQFYDKANHRAAIAFAEEHSQRLQKFDTLDLHYLYVKEAIPVLDIFIDRNINLLKGSSLKRTQDLYIITGRGKNSLGGVSRLQPAVKSRLRERKIHYMQLNPGLLKIKVTKDFLVTSDLR